MNSRSDREPCDPDGASQTARALHPGAHLVTQRVGYSHHGIYIGDGLVVHYRGFERSLRIGPVEAVSVGDFSRGRPLRVLEDGVPRFESSEIVRRAMSRIGEDRYHVLTNNCEHFCEWCLHEEPRSYQVDSLLHWLNAPRRLLRRAGRRATQVCALLASGLACLYSDRGFNQ